MTNTLDELDRAFEEVAALVLTYADNTQYDAFRLLLSERAELLATVRRQGDLLEFMAAYIGTPAKERETQWPAWSVTESKKEAVADYWAELASAAIIQTERERDK